MSLSQTRLKGKIESVLNDCQQENTDPNASKTLLADRLATAIIEEIKEIQINYTGGLTAPSSGGTVTGAINATIS